MVAMYIFIGLILGGLIFGGGDHDDCPRSVKGYNCKGSYCDHSKIELYRAKLAMAQNDETEDV